MHLRLPQKKHDKVAVHGNGINVLQNSNLNKVSARDLRDNTTIAANKLWSRFKDCHDH